MVFIKDNRLPPPGVNVKLRPRLQKSPFVVTGFNQNILYLTRVVDKFETRVNPQDAVKYQPSDQSLFEDIPVEIRRELGSTLTPAKILKLAEVDSLPLLFTENVQQTPRTGPTVVGRVAEQQSLAEAEAEEGEDEESWVDADLASEEKSVSFQT